MIDRTDPLPIKRQAELVNISRGSVYYEPEPIGDDDLKLMRRIDELHLELPFAGARMLRDLLRPEGFAVGRKHMTTLMRRMGITALYRKPNTSRKAPGHTIHPYLLRALPITRSNHVWAMDITYIPMARGFVVSVMPRPHGREVDSPSKWCPPKSSGGQSGDRCPGLESTRPTELSVGVQTSIGGGVVRAGRVGG